MTPSGAPRAVDGERAVALLAALAHQPCKLQPGARGAQGADAARPKRGTAERGMETVFWYDSGGEHFGTVPASRAAPANARIQSCGF